MGNVDDVFPFRIKLETLPGEIQFHGGDDAGRIADEGAQHRRHSEHDRGSELDVPADES
jgi:hypothetical protein